MNRRTDRCRLDVLLVERGMAPTREKAQRIVRAGQVRLGTEVLDKPGRLVDVDADLDVADLRERFVGRGGYKLLAAFQAFPHLSPCPPVCADIGASTGGFTDCLLQHGARRVYAIDVGAGQLDAALRNHPRVVVMERINARHLRPADLPEPLDLVVTDVSFISLRLILPPASALLKPGQGQVVALVKPQFEAGREDVGKGGIVRRPDVHERVLREIALELPEQLDMTPAGLLPSPIAGASGNREYLLHLVPPGAAPPIDTTVIAHAIDAAFQNAKGNAP